MLICLKVNRKSDYWSQLSVERCRDWTCY